MMWQRNAAAAFVIVAIMLNLSLHWHLVITILDNTTTDNNNAGDLPQKRTASSDIIGGGIQQQHATAVANNSSGNIWTPLPWSLPRIDITRHQSSVEFMLELETIKKKRRGIRPWKNSNTNNNNSSSSILLSTPIISLNLPKTGTTSLYDYFNCGGYVSAHTHAHANGDGKSIRIGDCVLHNFVLDNNRRPPFHGCNVTKLGGKQRKIQFFSDIGTVEPHCFYSTLHVGGLEHIVHYYPNATIIMLH